MSAIEPGRRIRCYAAAAGALLALDLFWLGVVAPSLYRQTIGHLLRPQPDLLAAALFYAIYLIGVCELVVLASPTGASTARVAGRGALLGFVAYATFDLTALSVLKDWSPLITVVDMAWGTLLTATAAAAAHRLGARGRPGSRNARQPS